MKTKCGVIAGDDLQALFAFAKTKQFALPAVNVINTSTVNAVMETAAELKSPAVIQFSNGGAQFYAGKARYVLTADGREASLRHIAHAKALEEDLADKLGAGEIMALKMLLKHLIANTDPGLPDLWAPTNQPAAAA